MAGTTVVNLAAGTQMPPTAVTPLNSILVGPAVQGGTVLLEFAPTQNGPWQTAVSATAGASYRAPLNQWVRATATGQVGTVAITDLGTGNIPGVDQLVNVNSPIASANLTTEQVIGSFRIPPNFLPPSNWRMVILASFILTNNVNVKTINIRANGLAGTLLAAFTATSFSVFNALLNVSSSNADGVTINGWGSGTGSGLGGSTTAVAQLVRDYINNETEFVITVTKATGTDTASMNALYVTLQ